MEHRIWKLGTQVGIILTKNHRKFWNSYLSCNRR